MTEIYFAGIMFVNTNKKEKNMEKGTKYYMKIITKVIMVVLAIVGIYISYKLAMFYLPFIIAMIIAAFVEPIIKFFMKYTKMKRKLASIVSLILVVIVIGGLLVGLSSKIIIEAQSLLANLNIYFEDVYNWNFEIIENFTQNLSEDNMEMIQNALTGIIDALKTVFMNLLTGLITVITSIPNVITYSIITLLAIVFICFDKQYLPNTIKSQIPRKWFEKIKQVIKEMCSVSVKYIKAEAKLSFICFVLVLTGLLFVNLIGIKVEYLLIMALLIGFVDILPLFGAGAVMLPWSGYLLITGNIHLAIAVAIIWIIWAVLKQIIEPKMVSKEMGMHPIFTLIGMYTGFRLAGVFGLILGPIILLIIKNIFGELINKGIFKSFFEME